MMIKIFTKNNDGKITLTPEELKSLLDEAYWEGCRASNQTITYTTPNWQPYVWDGSAITLSTDTVSKDTVFIGNMEDALLEKMNHRRDYVGRPSDPVCLVEDAPTIDAVPVVRCRNCKYYDTDGCNDGFGWCERSGRDHGSMDDHYCSDGEMK